jgi:hypothetical protein
VEGLDKIANKLWRLDNLYFIKTKRREKVPLQLNWAQRDFLTRRTNKSYILKARQLGFSTACLIDLLDDTIHNANTNSAIIAHKQDKVVKLFEIVKRAFEGLDPRYRPRVSLDNRNELYFPDLDSKIYVAMDTRSETVHNLHVSELAFIEHADEKMMGILESVPEGGKITYETTANGMVGYAYDEWTTGDSEFEKFFYPWYQQPSYAVLAGRFMEEVMLEYLPLATRFGTMTDIAERFELTPAQMEFYLCKLKRHKEMVVQEYPTTALEAFISSGRGVFHAADLQKHQAQQPIARKYGDLLVWEEPLPGFHYVLGVDPAEGTGNDNSVIEVFNANTGVQAAEYANNRVQADELSKLVIQIAKDYNRALVVPEINSPALISHLRRRYDNIYRREVFDKITQQKTKALGWRPTAMSKKKLVEDIEEAARVQDIQINSGDLLKEQQTFVRTDEPNKQGYGAEGSNHDNRVIATALAIEGMKESPRLKKYVSEAERKLKEFLKAKSLEQHMGPGSEELPSVKRRKRYALRGSSSPL